MHKFSTLMIALALTSTAPSFASDYNTFLNATYERSDNVLGDTDSAYALSAQHFFSQRTALGPLAEFDYMINESFIGAQYVNVDNGLTFKSVVGEAFVGNFIVGASYADQNGGSGEDKTVMLGYRVGDNLQFRARLLDTDDNNVALSARYRLDLDGNSYVGFNASTITDTDSYSLSTKYFTALESGRYIALRAGIDMVKDEDDQLFAGVDYYFNQQLSIGGVVGSNDLKSVSINYYVNDNFSARVGYSDSEYSENEWSVGLNYQF